MPIDNIPRTIWFEDGSVFLVDQTRLPLQGDVLQCNTAEGVCVAIKTLAVRGAPALGVAAALALATWTENETEGITTIDEYLQGLAEVIQVVVSTRPTAVNLAWGAERIRRLALENSDLPLDELKALVVQEALNMQAEDEERNRAIGQAGAELLPDEAKILTHCNAGSLATAYFGTALGVIFTAHEEGKVAHVWVDETRPVMQGGRLTAWELRMAGIPSAIITDSMAGFVMKQGWVDAVIVGGDRIAANGDTANKIGTYSLAVLAKEHGIPFYVAAPTSSFDLTLSDGENIPIEERDPREIMGFTVSGTFEPESESEISAFDTLMKDGPYHVPLARGHQMTLSRKGDGYAFDGWFQTTPPDQPVFNPAFDVTPGELITAIITERGIMRPEPDFETSIALMIHGSGSLHEMVFMEPEMPDTLTGIAPSDLGPGAANVPGAGAAQDSGASAPEAPTDAAERAGDDATTSAGEASAEGDEPAG